MLSAVEPTSVRCIDTAEDFQIFAEHLKNLPLETEQEPQWELRFPATVSLRKDFGAAAVIYDKKTRKVLMVPYDINYASEIEEEGVDIGETVANTVYRVVAKETGLHVKGLPKIIGSRSVKNTNSALKVRRFIKYIVLVEQYEGAVLSAHQILDKKNGIPVWISIDLLEEYVFQKIERNGKSYHNPHYYALKDFVKYLAKKQG